MNVGTTSFLLIGQSCESKDHMLRCVEVKDGLCTCWCTFPKKIELRFEMKYEKLRKNTGLMHGTWWMKGVKRMLIREVLLHGCLPRLYISLISRKKGL